MAALWLLVGAAALGLLGAPGRTLPPGTVRTLPSQAANGSSLHSLRFFYTAVSESGQGLSVFFAVAYVDNQPFYQYDSNSRRVRPRVPWMEKAGADFWDRETRTMKGKESVFRKNVAALWNHYNQSKGFHTWQKMIGCELREDGSKAGFAELACDGRDFISLDREALIWTAADPEAQISKRKWENRITPVRSCKAYLEEECIESLQTFLAYGKEILQRTEQPVGKVTHQAVGGSQEFLICQAHGFYPREIEATWRKGEEILEHETFRRKVAPNSDGTYHAWLSIEIDPTERDLYRCHVDHASLEEPLVLAFKEPGVTLGAIVGAIVGPIVGPIVGVVAFVLLVAFGIFFFITRDKSFNSSTRKKRRKKATDKKH